MSQFKKIICVDFDGVLHSYTSGWQGIDVIPDPPVEGAIDWLARMIQVPDFEINIYSSRSQDKRGILAMKIWLKKWWLHENLINQITFPTQKPAAWLTIDDRAICFDGKFPDYQTIRDFKSWNKKGLKNENPN